MRLLFIHNDYAKWSGEEAAAQGLAQVLADHGHEIAWFRRSSAELPGGPYGKVKAFCAGIHNPFAARALARHLDRAPADLVQVQNLYPLLSPSILRPIKERGIPLVMRCPNYRLFCPSGSHLCHGRVCERCLQRGREWWCVLKNCEHSLGKSLGYALRNAWARLRRSMVRNVDMFIVQTPFQKEKFVQRGIPASRIGIVPGCVSCDRPVAAEVYGALVTFVGRVSPEKGIEDFLAAARQMPEIPFAVAGSDEAMPELRTASPDNVRWLGFLPPDRLWDLYQQSRVIVVPSRCYEGFPNVMAQAMVCARPVVAARLGAMSSIVDDEITGLFFEAGNPGDLAAQLQSLYPDRERCRRMGEAGRRKALARYTPEPVYAALLEVYERALQTSRQRKRAKIDTRIVQTASP